MSSSNNCDQSILKSNSNYKLLLSIIGRTSDVAILVDGNLRGRIELERIQAELVYAIKMGNDSEEVRAKLLVVSFAIQELSNGEGYGHTKILKTKYLSLRMSTNIWGKAVWECDKCKRQFPAYGRLRKHKINFHAY